MPLRELERLKAVNRFLKLKISRHDELQRIAGLAAGICGTSIALITLIGEATQHILFRQGVELESTSRIDAFCNHLIMQKALMVVPDAREDIRFAQNPMVTGKPNIRFYAGAPLTTQDGLYLGSLCVIDEKTGNLDDRQRHLLVILARQVIQMLEFDASLELVKGQFLKAKGEEIKMRSFFDSCGSPHLLLDNKLAVIAFNRSMYEFIQCHYNAALRPGFRVLDIVDKEGKDIFINNCQAALSGQVVTSDDHLIYGDVEYHWSITYEPARNGDGEIIGISFSAMDISDHYRQQQAAAIAQQKLNKIAYVQSHELRRPVASIKGLLQLMEMEGYTSGIPQLSLIKYHVDLLDDKIHQIVGYTYPGQHQA